MQPRRLALAALAFAVAFLVLLIGPALLSDTPGPRTGVSAGDTLDLLSPLVLIPLTWLLFSAASQERSSVLQTLLFLLVAAAWVEGQGMHLSANSIGNILPGTAQEPIRSLAHFYDETLSHYLWHAGVLGLSALVLWRAWSAQLTISLAPFLVSGLLYGFTFFLITVEGGTVPMGLPAAAILAGAGLWRWRAKRTLHPVGALFVSGYLLAVVLSVAWAIWQGGFPQFTEVGWL